MIAFIDEHREAYGLEPICKVLPIAPSTYHAHAARRTDPGKRPVRARSDAALMVEIKRVFESNFCLYGVRKVWRQLAREGIVAARCTVERLMRLMGLQGVARGRKVRTTIPDPAGACPLDRVNRQFKAPHPNALWVNHARLQSAIAELRAWGADRDPETARRIRLGEEICLDLLNRLGPLLQKADHLNALLAVRPSDTPLPATPH